MDVRTLLAKGQAALERQREEEETAKVGTLRGGNSGLKLGDLIYGKCHRLSLLRFLGISSSTEPNRHLMFAAGRTNEDSWYELLAESWDGPILREDEIPVSWQTSNGTPVTGRPDIVLCENVPQARAEGSRDAGAPADESQSERSGGEPKPVLGLELKLVSSLWTALSVFLKKVPKSDHLIQAAHYSWQLGVPFELWYTSRVDWPILKWKWILDLLKGDGRTEIERDERGPKKLLPFYSGFFLDWKDGRLYYRHESATVWTPTAVTAEGVRDYYEYVSTLQETKDLGPRPTNQEVTGGEAGWNKCDAKYCPLAGVCDRHESNYDKWLDAATKELTKEGNHE